VNLYFFGGSFDPPHIGHLSIIHTCVIKSQQFVLIPTNQSPFKDQIPRASAYHRIRMLELLISNIEQPIKIDDWEINNPAPNYTYKTIRHLQKYYPGSNLFMVIGGDQLSRIYEWKNYREIMDVVRIVAFNRDKSKYKLPDGIQIRWQEDFRINISSTAVREKIIHGHQPSNELTPEVLEYIQSNNLYNLKT
tara:strand:- start:16 stop:591 length:576 start_codon:yes stop_codon:yes gene_type:complete